MNPMSARPLTGSTDRRSVSLADVVEHMTAQFDGRIDPARIVRVVRQCRRELVTTYRPTQLDAVEDLAMRRLNNLAEANSHADDQDRAILD